MTASFSFRNSISIRFCTLFALVGTFTLSSCELNTDEDTNPTNNRSEARFNPELSYGTVADIDGNIYKTIHIGDQTWMAENLRVTRYNDGSIITEEKDNQNWNNLRLGAFCSINHTLLPDSLATYGRLYNWYAVNTGKLAPKGWHIPNYADWNVLLDHFGGKNTTGGKLKEAGFYHWNSPNEAADNLSGFTAIPAGTRNDDGFLNSGNEVNYWCSNDDGTAMNAYYFFITTQSANLNWSKTLKSEGLSIRCVKD